MTKALECPECNGVMYGRSSQDHIRVYECVNCGDVTLKYCESFIKKRWSDILESNVPERVFYYIDNSKNIRKSRLICSRCYKVFGHPLLYCNDCGADVRHYPVEIKVSEWLNKAMNERERISRFVMVKPQTMKIETLFPDMNYFQRVKALAKFLCVII